MMLLPEFILFSRGFNGLCCQCSFIIDFDERENTAYNTQIIWMLLQQSIYHLFEKPTSHILIIAVSHNCYRWILRAAHSVCFAFCREYGWRIWSWGRLSKNCCTRRLGWNDNVWCSRCHTRG